MSNKALPTKQAQDIAELDSIQQESTENPAYAYVLINRYIKTHAPLARALVMRADLLIGFRQVKLAFQDLALAEWLCARPHPYMYELRGDAYAAQGRWALAERWYSRALSLAGENTAVEGVMIDCLLFQGKFAQAKAGLTKLWRERTAYTAYQFGQLYRYQEQNRRAARWFRKALSLEPDFAKAKHALEDVEMSLTVSHRDPGKMSTNLGSSTELAVGRRWKPEHPYSIMLRATALAKFGRLREAKALLPRLRKLRPNRCGAAQASIYESAERYQLAAKHNLKMATSETTGPWIYAGCFLARLGKYDEAERCHRQALQCAEGDFDEAWLNIGLLMRAQFRFRAARDYFKQALALDPNYSEAKDALRDISLALAVIAAR